MKWRITKKLKKNLAEWHPWFAWYPVQAGDYRYWLCYVVRRGSNLTGDHLDGYINWEYDEGVKY